jgi:hypothetical protein
VARQTELHSDVRFAAESHVSNILHHIYLLIQYLMFHDTCSLLLHFITHLQWNIHLPSNVRAFPISRPETELLVDFFTALILHHMTSVLMPGTAILASYSDDRQPGLQNLTG